MFFPKRIDRTVFVSICTKMTAYCNNKLYALNRKLSCDEAQRLTIGLRKTLAPLAALAGVASQRQR